VSVLAVDERRDIAIVKVAGFDLPVLDLGNSDALAVGEPAVIVGSPRGLEGTVTAGILSSIRDSGDGFKVLQTDAAVNPGNSGGPLVNNKGQAIGVVSFKLRSAEGLNFAIPVNYVRGLFNNLHEPMTLETAASRLISKPGSTLPARHTPRNSIPDAVSRTSDPASCAVKRSPWLRPARTAPSKKATLRS
jgi:S1-C subfamily serine protease